MSVSLFTAGILQWMIIGQVIFAEFSKPRDSEEILQPSSQTANCLPHTVKILVRVFNAERQEGKL